MPDIKIFSHLAKPVNLTDQSAYFISSSVQEKEVKVNRRFWL
jgi:hypothetical protein